MVHRQENNAGNSEAEPAVSLQRSFEKNKENNGKIMVNNGEKVAERW